MKYNIQHMTIWCVAVLITFSVFSCGRNGNNEKYPSENKSSREKSLTVFAAASLTGVLSEIADSFETRNNAKVKLNLASSGTLVRQMEQGANPDLFISASREWAEYADSAGLIQKSFKADIAKNQLVLIAPKESRLKKQTPDSTMNLPAMLGKGRISMGDPRHVPAGRYAKEALGYYGLFDQVEDRIIPAKDVRSALMVVEMNEAPLGIVYRTDIMNSEDVTVIGTFPGESHSPIVYTAGVCSTKKLANDFFTYLQSDKAKNIWIKYGFEQTTPAAP